MKSLLFSLILTVTPHAFAEDLGWQPMNGVNGVQHTTANSGRLMIIKVDPTVAPLTLINASKTEFNSNLRSTSEREGLLIGINAAMFRDDDLTSIGYMRNFDHVNASKHRSNLKGILAFNPKKKGRAAVKIIMKDGSWEKEMRNYNTVFESYRMIGRNSKGQWESKWNKGASIHHNVALAGVDSKDQLLLFFHRDSIDVYDLNNIIIALPLDLKALIYLDGGWHGGLYLHPSTGIGADTGFLNVPNVLGVKFPAQ